MRKVLGYILTPFHILVFATILIIFHPIQWVCFNVFGYQAHKKSVDILNWFLMKSLLVLGTTCKFENPQTLPTDRPIILVSNHQSLYDIPAYFWYMRKHHVKFVSKIELAKGIPSVSYNLRKGGSAVIDRSNPRQALPELKRFAQYIEENNYCAVIFPEGTRSRTGKPKSFSPRGFQAMIKYAPSALILPVTVNNSWKLYRYGKFPMSVGEKLHWKVHPPIDPKEMDPKELLSQVEATIKADIR